MVRSPTTLDLVLGGTRLKMGTDGSRRWGAPGHPAHGMETMTTTSYRLDGKARTNIGKAMTDLQLTANRCGPRRRTDRIRRLDSIIGLGIVTDSGYGITPLQPVYLFCCTA